MQGSPCGDVRDQVTLVSTLIPSVSRILSKRSPQLSRPEYLHKEEAAEQRAETALQNTGTWTFCCTYSLYCAFSSSYRSSNLCQWCTHLLTWHSNSICINTRTSRGLTVNTFWCSSAHRTGQLLHADSRLLWWNKKKRNIQTVTGSEKHNMFVVPLLIRPKRVNLNMYSPASWV